MLAAHDDEDNDCCMVSVSQVGDDRTVSDIWI